MPGVLDLPRWAGGLAAIAALGLLVWRMASLMATRKQKLRFIRGMVVVVAFLVVIAAAKNNTVNHALVLFIDAMLAFIVGTVPMGGEMRRIYRLRAETGSQQAMSQKEGTVAALVMIFALCVLVTVEYMVF